MASQLGINASGVIIRQVQQGSPAAEAGLRPGDVIVEVNRQAVKNPEDLRRAMEATQPGASLLLLVQRDGATSYLTVRV
jgi:serine protease Do